MAPARVEEDPVTAEYNVYLTPAAQEQIYLLQYPNRNRERPYNDRLGAAPNAMRIKPTTGYLELDVPMSTAHNFNKYQGLKWANALRSAKDLQNDAGTFGLPSGFIGQRLGTGKRGALKTEADRELDIENDMASFREAEKEHKVMATQTLGGQITRQDSVEEAGKPIYFVGAFRGSELHLTKVSGMVQMRPQFHHVDAEEQRNRIAASREHAAAVAVEATGEGSSGLKKDRATLIQQTFKTSNPKGDLDQRQKDMDDFLRTANEERWIPLDYVDEEVEAAYEMYHERLFVRDTDGVANLQSSMDNEAFLDAISAPRDGSLTRRRKRAPRKKDADDDDEDAEEG